MLQYVKAQAVLILGSISDFLTTFLWVECFHGWWLSGNLAGNVVGAATQFILSSIWVFPGSKNRIHFRLLKFVGVYTGNFLLSAGGVFTLTSFAGLHYMISKLICSVVLGLSVNYLLQKNFVFR